MKYQFLKWQQIFSILHILFHSSITDKTRLLSDMTMRTHDRCRIGNRNCLPIARTLVNNRVLVGSVLLIFIVFSVIFYFCFVCLRFVSCGTSSTYGEYISQLIRYSRACGSYSCFLDRELLLTWQLLNQGFLAVKLMSSNDHGYVQFVVITIRSFPHSWLITGFVIRVT